MSKPIRTYDDLLAERKHLENLLAAQKELVQEDFREVLTAAQHSVSSVTKAFTRDTGSLFLTSGANRVIDMVVKNFLLSRAGWFTRLVVPFFLKNVSSHYIAGQKEKWYRKLFSWIGQKNGKEHKTQE